MKRVLFILTFWLGLLPAAAQVPSGVPAEGEVHVLTLLVEFRNVRFSHEDPQALFAQRLEAVRAYYEENSAGAFSPVFDLHGPVLLDAPMSTYGKDRMEGGERLGDEAPEKALYEACLQLDGEVDFSRYDADGDGLVDLVLFCYAGYDQADGGSSDAIWSHHASLQEGADRDIAEAEFDGVKLDYYFCTAELRGAEGLEPMGMGTTVHELGHALGLPDFYDTDGAAHGLAGGMYRFSVMAMGMYNGDGDTPPALTVLEKALLGWADWEQLPLLQEGWMELPTGQAAWSPAATEGEFFVYEALPEGLLGYHVDRSERMLGGVPIRELWENWQQTNILNAYGRHPCCYVVSPADPKNYNAVSINPGSLLFPGTGGVRAFAPIDWDGASTGVLLSCIGKAEDGVRFRVLEREGPVLTGLVTDAAGGPMTGVTVRLLDGEEVLLSDITGMDGYFELPLSGLEAETVVLNVEKGGYRPYHKEMDLPSASPVLCETVRLFAYEAPAQTLLGKYDATLSAGYFPQQGAVMGAVRFTPEDLAPFVGSRIRELVCYPYVLHPESLGPMSVVADVPGYRHLLQPAGEMVAGEYTPVTVPLEADFRIPEGLELYLGYGFADTGDNNPLSAVYPGGNGNSYFAPFAAEHPAWKPMFVSTAGFYMDLMLDVRLEEVPSDSLQEMGFNCIQLRSGPYVAGESIDLQVLTAEDVREQSWQMDEKPLSGPSVTLTVGEHSISVTLLYRDGRQETLSADLTVF